MIEIDGEFFDSLTADMYREKALAVAIVMLEGIQNAGNVYVKTGSGELAQTVFDCARANAMAIKSQPMFCNFDRGGFVLPAK